MHFQGNTEANFAMDAVRQAALLVRKVQQELVSPALTKEDRSPVTVADFTSQALIGYLLGQSFPNDPLVAEEDSATLRAHDKGDTLQQVTRFVQRSVEQATPETVCTWIDHGRVDSAPRFWTLDPIDGTKGFLRGEQYAVALALVVDGQVEVAALGCPNITGGGQAEIGGPGSLVIAVRGQGSWSTSLENSGEFKRLYVSTREDPSQARILRSVEAGHTNISQIDTFAQALHVQADPVRMDSQAKYAVLASGEGELILRLLSPSRPEYKEKIWDQAAGSLVLQEAGGMITDLRGNPLDFTTGRKLVNNRGILASNSLVHEDALKALQVIGA